LVKPFRCEPSLGWTRNGNKRTSNLPFGSHKETDLASAANPRKRGSGQDSFPRLPQHSVLPTRDPDPRRHRWEWPLLQLYLWPQAKRMVAL